MSKKISKLAKHYEVVHGRKFRLKQVDPGDTGKFKSEKEAAGDLAQGCEQLCQLQEKLYAQAEWSLLLVFQAMDAGGKDGTIKHVLSGVNPQGCEVTNFRAPSEKELKHDFLWRASLALPERGRIGIFNRSYYEEVIVVRVHPDYLKNQKLPEELVTKKIWDERYECINDFETYLGRNGIVVLKFFLHISPEEQKRRILERLNDDEKNWKFEASDVEERKLWPRYQKAFEEMVQATATKQAPWHVIPADNKWFARLVVSSIIVDKLKSLDLHLPELDAKKKAEMKKARADLARGVRKR